MKALVIQHRHELLQQNMQKFHSMYPEMRPSIFNADTKDFEGDVVFASVQTLQRFTGTYPHFDIMATDEAHHAVALSYVKIYEAVKSVNPKVKHLGVTATPNRGDRIGLSQVYDNVADQIEIAELVESGHLVKPRVFVLTLGCEDELKQIYQEAKGKSENRLLEAASKCLNAQKFNDKVVDLWAKHAHTRKTVLFATSIDHAKAVTESFLKAGHKATHVNGEMSIDERTCRLQAFSQGDYQVITNVAVLTEGWDCPDVSCVILLRPSSYKSTMIQMVGRGLRTAPNKTDCIILDFGMSSEKHGNLEQTVDLYHQHKQGDAPTKKCPECKYENPIAAEVCEYCGYKFPTKEQPTQNIDFGALTLRERTFLEESLYKWEHLTGEIYAAQHYDTVLVIKHKNNDKYALFHRDYSSNFSNPEPFVVVFRGTRTNCFRQADKMLDERNRYGYCQQNNPFTMQPITSAQKRFLTTNVGKEKSHQVKTKYKASMWISMITQWKQIIEDL